MVLTPTVPIGPPLPQNWGFTTPKILIAIISGTGKATDFEFGWYTQGACEQKPIQNFGEKGAWALPKFFEYLVLSQEWVKLQTSNFVRTFVAVGILRD